MTTEDKIRMQYAGTIRLLCDCSLLLGNSEEDDEQRELIMDAAADWCNITGWTVRRVLQRIELYPPKQ